MIAYPPCFFPAVYRMSLTLTYRGGTTIPVEVEGVVPAALREQSPAQIEARPIWHGNRQLPLAEFFTVAGDPSDEKLTFVGDLSGVHWIGAKMDRGVIRVEGNGGRHLGSELAGGEIHVSGSAGDWVGGEMRGGLIHVRGNAGNLVGSAYRGSPRGMTGGTILVGGNAGDEIAHSMRRGLIAVGGDTGDFPCLNLIAGTVFVFGTTGKRAAAGMRRGTLAVFGERPQMLHTFKQAGCLKPVYLRIYFAMLRRHGFPVPADLDDADYRMYTGDSVTVGKGEVLVRESAG
jgi:formylmethanofuran dehydrogenase subunit C